jgi:hypothetical protein
MRNISCRLFQHILVGKKWHFLTFASRCPNAFLCLTYTGSSISQYPGPINHTAHISKSKHTLEQCMILYMAFSLPVQIFHIRMNCWSIKISYIYMLQFHSRPRNIYAQLRTITLMTHSTTQNSRITQKTQDNLTWGVIQHLMIINS